MALLGFTKHIEVIFVNGMDVVSHSFYMHEISWLGFINITAGL